MEETGILVNLACFACVLPHFEPGPENRHFSPFLGTVQMTRFVGNMPLSPFADFGELNRTERQSMNPSGQGAGVPQL
jgi:hypothetical protein